MTIHTLLSLEKKCTAVDDLTLLKLRQYLRFGLVPSSFDLEPAREKIYRKIFVQFHWAAHVPKITMENKMKKQI